MQFNKIITGFVIQTYEDTVCIDQEFIEGEHVEYENMDGTPIDFPENEKRFPTIMVRPGYKQSKKA